MGDFFVWAMDRLGREGRMILRAWPSLILIMALVVVAVWWGTSTYYAAQYQGTIRNLETARDAAEKRRDLAEDELSRAQNGKSTAQPQSDKSSAQLRLEQLQQQRTQPYTIRKADQEEFVRVLKLSGKFSVNIEYSYDDDLAEIFAGELATLLTLSKWEVNGNEPAPVVVSGRKYSPGVTIETNKEQEVPVGASLLLKLLAAQEIGVNQLPVPPRKVHPASFDIFIGAKE